MHNASCLAGMAFNNAGLGISHSIAHAIGGKLHIAHGRINGTILPFVIEFNSEINNSPNGYSTVALKLQKLAKKLGLVAINPFIAVNNIIKAINDLNKNLKIPKTFKDYGIDLSKFESEMISIISIISSIQKDICTKTNPVKVTPENCEQLIKKIKG